MKKFLALGIAALAFAVPASSSMAQTLTIYASQPGSLTHSVSSAIAAVVSENTDLRMLLTPQQADGQDEVNDGLGEFATGTFLSAFANAQAPFTDYKHENLRAVGVVMPLRSVIYVKDDSPYKTFADLKGTRMYCEFAAVDAATALSNARLANEGFTKDDVKCLSTQNIVTSADGFTSGKVDSFVFAVGSAKVQEVQAAVGKLRALPFKLDESRKAEVEKFLPGVYEAHETPAPFKTAILEPLNLIAWPLYLFVNKDVPDDVVEKVTEAVHDHKDDMAKIFAPLATFDVEKMNTTTESGVIFHPGALAYYKKMGM